MEKYWWFIPPADTPSHIKIGGTALAFHQVAVIVPRSIEVAVGLLKGLGFDQWVQDHATLSGKWRGKPCRFSAHMWFNYQIIPNREFELLQYDYRHPNYRSMVVRGQPFLSHMSAYVEDMDAAVNDFKAEKGLEPFHTFATSHHSNPAVAGKKRFREAIFHTAKEVGFNIKLIQKVYEPENQVDE